MHSTWARVNNVFFFALASLAAISVFVNLSTAYILPEPVPTIAQLRVNEIRRFSPHRGQDKAFISYDLEFDLTSVFNWNVKQLFVFLVAEYQSESNDVNQVVVFDQIIQDKTKAMQQIQAGFNKYPLIDYKKELKDVAVKYKLYWDVMPYVGALNLQKLGSYEFQMPDTYF
mmetsp:Transcript_13530/g.16390  ORF Transcript_13530/g.16390 Transcript_13530/m.16390 type:complete len:171 (+) Transcript_13530:216-728(+)